MSLEGDNLSFKVISRSRVRSEEYRGCEGEGVVDKRVRGVVDDKTIEGEVVVSGSSMI